MNRPFLKTLNGKFVSRSVLLTLAIALVVGGLAIASLRSLSSTANDAVANAQNNLPAEAVAPLEGLANDISSASSTLMLLLILITVAGAVAAGALAFVFARQITSPIVRLRNAAMKSASALPEFVEASASGEEELPELPVMNLNSGDEVEDLAHSFEQVQRTAAELAITQARVRKQNSERFVNLGRRSQNLLARQMKFIDSMEKDERNPANLQRLFQIDHLATRMRRNAESILVLADKSSPRRLRRPVSMHQVVQAASSEIEHFDRISISDISGASVDGSVATDLAHLLAELLENATSFAAPEAATMVQGQPTEHGYLLEIVDHGIGMEADKMAAANARFADESGELDDTHAPAFLGHDVVGRLARRHDVRLQLSPTPTGGVTVRLHVPHTALARPSDEAGQPAAPVEPVVAQGEPAAYASDESAFSGLVTPSMPTPAEPATAALPEPPLPEPPLPEPVLSEPVLSEPALPEPVLSEPPLPEPAFDEALPGESLSEALLIDEPLPERPVNPMPVEEELPPVPSTIDAAMYTAALDEAALNDQAAALIDSAFPEDATFPEAGLDAEHGFNTEPSSEAADQVEELPVESPVVPPASPFDSEFSPLAKNSEADFGDRGLTAEQRAAIEWAIEKGGGSVSAASPSIFEVGPIVVDSAGTTADGSEASELRAGPIDASELAELETTPSGFRRRRRGEQGGEIFDSPPVAAGPVATPNSPDQLLAFRQGLESGRAEARSNDGDIA